MRFICHCLKMYAAELCLKMNLHLLDYLLYCACDEKNWDCVKGCVESVCIYIMVALRFILRYIRKCGNRKIVM